MSDAPAGGLSVPLRRATGADRAALVALQAAAYAPNRERLGVEPLPLQADYDDILRAMEVWLAEREGVLTGALIVEPRAADLLIWSVATHPSAQGTGVGRALLEAAEARAQELGRTTVRLYTGSVLADRIAWYGRHGYAVERVEVLSDRSITHMIKRLDGRKE